MLAEGEEVEIEALGGLGAYRSSFTLPIEGGRGPRFDVGGLGFDISLNC